MTKSFFIQILLGISLIGSQTQKLLAQEIFPVEIRVEFLTNGAPKGATVIVDLDTVQADPNGTFKTSLPVGKHSIKIGAESHQEILDSILVLSDPSPLKLGYKLRGIEEKTMDVARIVAKKKSESSVGFALKSRQISGSVVDILSSEDMKRTNIRTTADAIKRIPGATIVEGKYANIRGMYDRYNAGYLNGSLLPSTESDRKAFSFDIIPASLIDNITIIKSGSPDQIGDFGGGIIRINTKSVPDKLTQTLSLGFQTNSITTGRETRTFESQGSELIGIPGSEKKIPTLDFALTGKNPEKNAEQSLKFNNNWSLKSITPMPTPRFSYTIGGPIKIGKKELGVIGGINYSLTNRKSEGRVMRNDLSDNRVISLFNDSIYNFVVQNGGILNFSIKINKENRIEWKNLYNLNYESSSILRGGTADMDNQLEAEGYSSQSVSNGLRISQILGSHSLRNKKISINWILSQGGTSKGIPDYRIAQYSIQDGTRYLSMNDFFNAGSGRFFSSLKEKTLSGGLDLKGTVFVGKSSHTLKSGVFFQTRKRFFSSREFVYGPIGRQIIGNNSVEKDLSPDNISADGIYLVEKTTKDADEYEGISNLESIYAMSESQYPLFKRGQKTYDLRVIWGLRVEKFSQSLQNDYFRSIGKILASPEENLDLLPSVNTTVPLGKKSSLRLSYYKSLNRPEMRELAPFSFYNFNINSEIAGNPTLRRSKIQNFDLRFESFPKGEDLFSAGIFWKKISNPIEFSLNTSQALIRTLNYSNENLAEVGGVELEVRKKLDFLGNLILPNLFKWSTFYSNLSLIHSRVDYLGLDGIKYTRRLQGQSPYVINLSFFYDNPKSGLIFNTTFNQIGSRISIIGVDKSVQPFGTDIYEFGRGVWDIQMGKNFKSGGSIRLTLGDILAQNSVFYQDLDSNGRYSRGDNSLFSFTFGRTLTLGYSLTL